MSNFYELFQEPPSARVSCQSPLGRYGSAPCEVSRQLQSQSTPANIYKKLYFRLYQRKIGESFNFVHTLKGKGNMIPDLHFLRVSKYVD